MNTPFRVLYCILGLAAIFSPTGFAQSGSFSAGAAGGATAGALGGALNSGAGSTSAASSTGAGSGGAAPIEVNIMVYRGMTRLANSIADLTKSAFPNGGPILIEDPASSLQVGLYESLMAYYQQLQLLHSDLELSFSLQISSNPQSSGSSLDFSNNGVIALYIRNVTSQKLRDLQITDDNSHDFNVDSTNCPQGTQTLDPNASCQIQLSFNAPAAAPAVSTTFNGTITITVDSLYHNNTRRVAKIVPLTATIAGHAPHAAPPVAANPSFLDQNKLLSLPLNTQDVVAALAGGGGAPVAGGGAASASSTPQWITNFGALGTAIGGLKSGMSYSSSSVQPSTQSFEVLLENELRMKSFAPYTSTSMLFVDKAVNTLTGMLGDMMVYTNDISNWATICKPTAATTKAPGECAFPIVAANLAAAQQLTTGYTSLLQNSNDGTGNTVLMDILHGAMLYQIFPCSNGQATCEDAAKVKIPSLQVSVAAAGGSTRVNAFFLVNIFYLPKPSYNGGAIVTFELRNADNVLVQSGARTAFYDYNKHWLGDDFVNLDKNTNRDCKVIKDGGGVSTPETFCVPR